MKFRAVIAALAATAAIALPAATSAQDRIGPGFTNNRPDGPSRRDWLLTAARTPEGGFRIGNPNAEVKVVEYLSTTCPHCAEFAHEGGPRLFQQHVRNGHVSV
ncbi:MAG TPA: thioredoxin domain-containing protein, partial [Allosphingosinicella sp.]|nr:thioredoxin domain-containing protein [Allosphingosinicella sp.]